MSQPKDPPEAKLLMGLLFRDTAVQLQALEVLCNRFGPLDFLSEPEPFVYTSYYDEELGKGIQRQLLSFLDLFPQDTLPDIKLITNGIEKDLSIQGKRRVNIDPGMLTEERLVLATGKNFTHRIYLGKGIYGDLTLLYQGGSFRALPWTYPDYKAPMTLHFLGVLRQKLQFQRNGRIPRKAAQAGESA